MCSGFVFKHDFFFLKDFIHFPAMVNWTEEVDQKWQLSKINIKPHRKQIMLWKYLSQIEIIVWCELSHFRKHSTRINWSLLLDGVERTKPPTHHEKQPQSRNRMVLRIAVIRTTLHQVLIQRNTYIYISKIEYSIVCLFPPKWTSNRGEKTALYKMERHQQNGFYVARNEHTNVHALILASFVFCFFCS